MQTSSLPHEQGRTARPARLNLIEAARGLAACGVLTHHLDLLLEQPRYLGQQVLGGALFPGYHGVDFFFVLSGFIITYAHWEHVGESKKVGVYLKRRAARILPIYWIVTSLLVCIYALNPQLGQPNQHDLSNIAASYLLLPVSEVPVLGVAWTLRYEAVFYLVFALVIWRPRIGVSVCAAWFVACLVSHEPDKQQVSPLSMHNAQFIIGMIACVWVKRTSLSRATAVATAGCLLLGVMYILEALFAPHFGGGGPAYDYRDTLATGFYGAASAIAIGGLAALDIRGYRWSVPSPLTTLGAASYSIYLTHGALLSLSATALFKFGLVRYVGAGVTITLMATFALLGGVIFWKYVENPLQTYFRTARRRAAQPQAVGSVVTDKLTDDSSML